MTQTKVNANDDDDGGAATAAPGVEWHLARDGQQYGPLKLVEIAKLVELGHLKDADLVWRAGFADWRPLGEVRDEIVPPAPKPLPAPTALMAPNDSRQRPNPADVTAAATAAPRANDKDAGRGSAAPAPAELPSRHAHPMATASRPDEAGATVDMAPRTGAQAGQQAVTPQGAQQAGQPAASPQADWQKRLELLTNRDFDGPIGGHPETAQAPRADSRGQPGPAGGGMPQHGVDPHLSNARTQDSKAPDPRGPDPRHADPRHADPRRGDPRQGGFRPADQMPVDPRLAGGRPQAGPDRRAMPDPRASDPRAMDPRAMDRAMDSRAMVDPRARQLPAEPARMRNLPPEDETEFDEPPRRGGVIRVLASLILLALIGAGTGYAYMNRAMLLDMLGMASSEGPSEPVASSGVLAKRTAEAAAPADPIRQQLERSADATGSAGGSAGISAGQPPSAEPQRQAAMQPAMVSSQPPIAPAAPPSGMRGLMATPLWSSIAAQFPDWAASHNSEVAKLREQRVPDDTIDARLMEAIVELRRKNADDALAAPEQHVVNVASAFLVNLKALAAKSTEACYGFISRGETSPAVLPLIGRDGAVTKPVLAQLDAVVAAIAAGKQSPEVYVQPFASDYTTLSDELIKRGWSRADLELFSNPQALSKATPEQVCRLVTGWFEAQLGIPKKDVQLRLLRQSLRPVVSG